MQPIALAVIVALAWPQAVFAQSLTPLVAELVAPIKATPAKRVAVLEFEYPNSMASNGPSLIQERITTAMARQHVGVLVERSLLKRVMGELRLQASGIMDPATVKQVGRVLGVDLVIMGTLNDVADGKVEVNARLVDVESATVLSASSLVVNKTWADSSWVAQELPYQNGATGLVATKQFMDAKLADAKRGVIANLLPTTDGSINVGGVTTSGTTLNNAIMKAILDETQAAGFAAPPMAEGE